MRKVLTITIFLSLILGSKVIFAGTIDEINKRGALRVCALADRLPFSSRDTSEKGFQIELAEEIAKDLGVSLEITWLRYRFHARKAGCDMMMEAVSKKGDDENKRDIEGAKPLTRASDSEKRKFPPTSISESIGSYLNREPLGPTFNILTTSSTAAICCSVTSFTGS